MKAGIADYDRIQPRCPVCGDRLVMTLGGGVRLWCSRAIGEAHFDRDLNKNVFQPEDLHRTVDFSLSDPRIVVQVEAWEQREYSRYEPIRRLQEAQAA